MNFKQSFLHLFSFLIILLSIGCSPKTNHVIFPIPVDTHDKTIQYQEKKTYHLQEINIYASNQFDGARMNNFNWEQDSLCQVTILPENEPINESPYYAFKMWADTITDINLQLYYPTCQHRYRPKYSLDGTNWQSIDSSLLHYNIDSSKISFKLKVPRDTIWVAGQEILNSTHNLNWIKKTSLHPSVQSKIIGTSTLGKDVWMMDISNGPVMNKEIVVIMGRQHPPEVTGYLAMKTFVEELLSDNHLSIDFIKKYRVLVFPMINPDGVDLGHWRHNANGIDLNRDWSMYRQKEVKLVVEMIDSFLDKDKNDVILGLDFHSTQNDLYYTLPKNVKSKIHPFTNYWLENIGEGIPGYKPYESPDKIGKPVSKSWFYLKYNAESITYEIGDETKREFVHQKASIAAREMMKLLILKN